MPAGGKKIKNQKSFLFDINKCTGCGACVIACETEQSINEVNTVYRVPAPRAWRQVFTFNESRHPALPHFHLSLACNHCAEPVCLKNCPAKAYNKDKETGAVFIDPKKCMGCKYCTWACPYDAPKYNSEQGITEKCDFCLHRIKENKKPACIVACPTGALQFEENSNSPPVGQNLFEKRFRHLQKLLMSRFATIFSKKLPTVKKDRVVGFTEVGIQPAVNFIPLRRLQQPECTSPPQPEAVEKLFFSSIDIPKSKISLKAEWALLLFTTIAYILVAFFTASLTGAPGIEPFLFLGAGAAVLGLTFVHLGQKSRAPRAILNWRTSWLSREILFFSLFIGLAGLYLLFFSGVPALGWATALVGFVSLYSIDKIYQVAMQVGSLNFHSAHVLFNGFFLYGFLAGNYFLFLFFGLLKFGLYIYRKAAAVPAHEYPGKQAASAAYKRPKRLFFKSFSISFLRIVFGFIIPAWLFFAGKITGDMYLPAAACVIIGELIDRGEYYDELDVITPPKQMLIDLLSMLKGQDAHNR